MYREILEMVRPSAVNPENAKRGTCAETIKTLTGKNASQALDNAKTVLLGVNETSDKVRKAFYELYRHEKESNITDMGNILSIEDMSKITAFLADRNIFTVILGNPDSIMYCYDALSNKTDKMVVSSIAPGLATDDNKYISELFNRRKSNLFDFNILAYQQYLSSVEDVNLFNDNYFQTIRLGEVRNDVKTVEPMLRDSDMLSIDIQSVRYSDSMLCGAGPNGLYAEEICKLAALAGFADKLKIAIIFGFENSVNELNTSYILTAQTLWYLIEGYLNRKNENILNNVKGLRKILVNLDSPSCRLVFYHSELSERWWMEVEDPVDSKTYITACSEQDYRDACNRETPVRWVWYGKKLIRNFKTR